MRTNSLSDTKESRVSVTGPSERAHVALVDSLSLSPFLSLKHTRTYSAKGWVICQPCIKTVLLGLISISTLSCCCCIVE